MAPTGVTLHFARIETPAAVGKAGEHAGMEERSRAYREGLVGPTQTLSQLRPAVVLLAHTASSYALGFGNEQDLVDRIAGLAGSPALLGTPYPESISRQGKVYWEAAGFEIAGYHRLEGVTDIYAENEERAYLLARQADAPGADAVL